MCELLLYWYLPGGFFSPVYERRCHDLLCSLFWWSSGEPVILGQFCKKYCRCSELGLLTRHSSLNLLICETWDKLFHLPQSSLKATLYSCCEI